MGTGLSSAQGQARVYHQPRPLSYYIDIDKNEFSAIAEAIAARKKNAVLNIRVNSRDLKSVKEKARKLGIKYQTFISEIIHRIAQAQ